MTKDVSQITKLEQSSGETSFEFLTYQLDGRIGAYHGVNG